MKPWTEDNFLERLMPQLRRENGAPIEFCPDSELLSAFTDGQASPFVREAIAAHLTRCSKCQEIYERLGQFATASVPAQDAEWVNAEKRLNNWMGGFLRARVDETRSQQEVEPSTPVLRWKGILKAAFSWKVGWAVGVAAVLVFGVAGVVLTRYGPSAPQWYAKLRQPDAPIHIVEPPPAPLPETLVRPTLRPQGNPVQTNDNANGSAKVAMLEQKPHLAIRNNTSPQKTPPPAPVEAAHLGKPQAVPPPQSSGTNSGGTSQMARSYSPSGPGTYMNGPPAHAPSGRGIPMPLPTSSAFVSRQEQTQPPSAPGGNTSPAVADFRLEGGTYLWIWLNRTLPNDGTFTFHGTLMPPVARSGAVLLSPGTEIDGSGTVKHGEVASILVTEIVFQGVRYKLRGKAGAINMSSPGSGWAVPFYEGQELEMQLTSASVYERPSGGTGSSGQYLGMSARTHAGTNDVKGTTRPTQAGKPVAPAPPQN